jgi:hypothetical protein
MARPNRGEIVPGSVVALAAEPAGADATLDNRAPRLSVAQN